MSCTLSHYMHSFTQNDLLQYLYKETSPAKSLAIKLALDCDQLLQGQLQQLKETMTLLNDVTHFSPSAKTMYKILGEKEKSTGKR